MIHSATQSPKFVKLVRKLRPFFLGVPVKAETLAVGLLEKLWHTAIISCPRGDIGKLDDDSIAEAIGWEGKADEIVSILVECGWLDRCAANRLLIHDWHEHAPGYIKKNIDRRGGFLVFRADTHAQNGSTEEDQARKPAQMSQNAHTPNITKHNITKPNPNDAASQQCYPAEFDQFWKAYPVNSKGRKVGKKTTLALWSKIPAGDRGLLIEAATAYGREQTEFVRDPERFLKADYWRDFTTPAEKPVRKSRVATAEDLANWSPYGDYE